MIEATELEKYFGTVHAVRGVSLSVKRGEVLGFLGPNGAGKTSTFRMLAGTIGPSAGRVSICGHDLFTDPLRAKSKLGYMPELAPLYPELSAQEYLFYRAELKGLRGKERQRAVSSAAEQSLVGNLLGTRIAHLSKGYRQRVALADALLGQPPVLLLDEPTAGLDPNQVLEVRKLIASLKEDHAILISTHILSEVEATCSRALVIVDGQVVAQGSLDELRKLRGESHTLLTVKASSKALNRALSPLLQGMNPAPPVAQACQHENQDCSQIELPQTESLTAEAIRLCVTSQLPVIEVRQISPALDEVFSKLTREASSKENRNNSDTNKGDLM